MMHERDACSGITERILIRNLLPEVDPDRDIRDILNGLGEQPPSLSCKYFYDARGSELFEQITGLPEYYPTRTEMALIGRAARHLAGRMEDVDIVELGSGDCSKISTLLRGVPDHQLEKIRYCPIDISESAIRDSARRLAGLFPALRIEALVADFTACVAGIGESGSRRLFCFFGSTLGNMTPTSQGRFFDCLRREMKPGDQLLLGVDMVKDPAVMERAYNDSRGVTAAFNLNILNVINGIASTDFDPGSYAHRAFYRREYERIEMHLEALSDQDISSPHLDGVIRIRKGEAIHTECSHKFRRESVEARIRQAQLEIDTCFTDEKGWFSLFLCERTD